MACTTIRAPNTYRNHSQNSTEQNRAEKKRNTDIQNTKCEKSEKEMLWPPLGIKNISAFTFIFHMIIEYSLAIIFFFFCFWCIFHFLSFLNTRTHPLALSTVCCSSVLLFLLFIYLFFSVHSSHTFCVAMFVYLLFNFHLFALYFVIVVGASYCCCNYCLLTSI